MKITKFIIPGFLVWSIQLMFSDLLAIDTVRPDFCVILVLYWSIMHGRMFGTVMVLIGLLIDLQVLVYFWVTLGLFHNRISWW